MKKAKHYTELTIRDHFMFGKVCSKPENRKLILDSLLQIDFKEKNGAIEKFIQEYHDAKYVRLDLLVQDESGVIYNTEMQNKSSNPDRQKELPKRSRYYQSILDTAHFESGKTYRELPETFIIFICTFDPFGMNMPIYTFETRCSENSDVPFNDSVHKIFFNVTADLSGLPKSLKNMLSYINDGIANDNATRAIEHEIVKARHKEEWREEYMLTLTYRNEIYAEALEEGIVEGREEGRQEGLKEGRQEGLKEGRQKGLKEGRQEGLKEGRQEGLKEGRQEGLKEGRQEGLKEGRQEGLKEGYASRQQEVDDLAAIVASKDAELKRLRQEIESLKNK